MWGCPFVCQSIGWSVIRVKKWLLEYQSVTKTNLPSNICDSSNSSYSSASCDNSDSRDSSDSSEISDSSNSSDSIDSNDNSDSSDCNDKKKFQLKKMGWISKT